MESIVLVSNPFLSRDQNGQHAKKEKKEKWPQIYIWTEDDNNARRWTLTRTNSYEKNDYIRCRNPSLDFPKSSLESSLNLSIYVSNQIIAPAPRVPRNSHARRICHVSWKYRDKPRWIKKFQNTRNNFTIISCHRVFFADWLTQFKKEMITKQTCFFFF